MIQKRLLLGVFIFGLLLLFIASRTLPVPDTVSEITHLRGTVQSVRLSNNSILYGISVSAPIRAVDVIGVNPASVGDKVFMSGEYIDEDTFFVHSVTLTD
ncbi:MAG: hypothetical protein ACI8Y7_001142 [Candidatus Woesearchaeota archaeon]|jgi:hypothetical protein